MTEPETTEHGFTETMPIKSKFEVETAAKVNALTFHAKKPLILAGLETGEIKLWDYRSKSELIHAFDKRKGPVRGVDFHKSVDIFVSGGDDREINVWEWSKSSSPTVTLSGHSGTIRSVQFHGEYPWIVMLIRCHRLCSTQKKDVIVSTSEDKLTKIWQSERCSVLHQFKRSDRFFCLAMHPEVNLVAAGHDYGVIVFKPLRDRPPYAVCGDSLLYVKNFVYMRHDFLTQIDSPIVPLARRARTSFYHPQGRIIVSTSSDSIAADLMLPYMFVITTPFVSLDGKLSAYLLTTTHLWLPYRVVVIKDLDDKTRGEIVLPIASDAIFYGGEGLLVRRSKQDSQHSSQPSVYLFDIAEKRGVMAELQTQETIRYVVWSNDMESVALLSKHTILIASKKLVIQGTCHETKAVISGAWENNGVFIYSTLHHIKYCLPNGESGIIKSLDVPIYITKVSDNMIYYLDRNVNTGTISFDADEYLLKVSLLRKEYDQVSCIIKNSSAIHKEAMAFYLRHKGFPEFALHLVEDERVRFKLALETCNFREAVASAAKIDKKEQWHELGVKALSHGIVGTAELSFQKAKDFQKLSHLYIITGNRDKLSKLMKIAEGENNVMGQFQSALFLGDVEERVKILEKAGHVHLAYITASVHGLKDIAERLSTTNNVPSLPEGKTPLLLMPPCPVKPLGCDWPLVKPLAQEVADAEPIGEQQPVERSLIKRYQAGKTS